MTKILVATDGSEHAAKVVDEAILLARALEADVSVISVAEIPAVLSPDLIALYREKLEREAQVILDHSKKEFAEKGLTVETIFKAGHPSTEICGVAEEGNYDIIVIGSRGLGKIKELILGSVSNRVTHCARASVFIVK